MDEATNSREGRARVGPWIMAVVILLAVGGAFWWFSNQQSCDRWREDVRALADDIETAAQNAPAAAAVNETVAQNYLKPYIDRLGELDRSRPDDCPVPSTILDNLKSL